LSLSYINIYMISLYIFFFLCFIGLDSDISLDHSPTWFRVCNTFFCRLYTVSWEGKKPSPILQKKIYMRNNWFLWKISSRVIKGWDPDSDPDDLISQIRIRTIIATPEVTSKKFNAFFCDSLLTGTDLFLFKSVDFLVFFLNFHIQLPCFSVPNQWASLLV
jgi:hypothetical protein